MSTLAFTLLMLLVIHLLKIFSGIILKIVGVDANLNLIERMN